MALFQSHLSDGGLRVGEDHEIHVLALVRDLQGRVFVEIRRFHPKTRRGDSQLGVLRRNLLPLNREIMQAITIPLNHTDEKPNLYYRPRNREVANNEPDDGNSLSLKRAARFANFR